MLQVRLGRHDPMVPGFGYLPASTATPAQIPPTDFISSRNCRHAQSSACDTRVSRPIVNSGCFAPACLRAPRAGVDPVSGGWCVVLRCRPSSPGGGLMTQFVCDRQLRLAAQVTRKSNVNLSIYPGNELKAHLCVRPDCQMASSATNRACVPTRLGTDGVQCLIPNDWHLSQLSHVTAAISLGSSLF